ncbi:MAG: hypothetical protein ACFN1I_11095 [Selenomonas artemidis]
MIVSVYARFVGAPRCCALLRSVRALHRAVHDVRIRIAATGDAANGYLIDAAEHLPEGRRGVSTI